VRRVRRLLDARIACHSPAMPDPITHPHLAAVRKALAVGDMNALRAALADLDDEERRLLEVRLGPGGVDRLQASAQRRRRARSRGRVVVIHGIMGAQLDVLAYRHYGDPTERLQHADASADDGGSRRSRPTRRRRRG
jgi:hypothetical protein